MMLICDCGKKMFWTRQLRLQYMREGEVEYFCDCGKRYLMANRNDTQIISVRKEGWKPIWRMENQGEGC